MKVIQRLITALGASALLPEVMFADTATSTARDSGVSAIWVLANFCYAGMRAQDQLSGGWRVVSFIFGFPGTLLSMWLVAEGGERVYGVDVPRRQQ